MTSLIRAIQYAQDNGAPIRNLSLFTTSYDQALYQTMVRSGLLFVVSARNGDEQTGTGMDLEVSSCYPASFDLPDVISVVNLSYDGTLCGRSNYGSDSVDLAAPGIYIPSTTADQGYGYMAGTSVAAPMVSAAATLACSYGENISSP